MKWDKSRRCGIFLGLLLISCLFLAGCDGSPADSDGGKTSSAAATTPTQTERTGTEPSIGKGQTPTADTSPLELLDCYVDCLRKGDVDTFRSLFSENVDIDGMDFVFYGPLVIEKERAVANWMKHDEDEDFSDFQGDTAYVGFFFDINNADKKIDTEKAMEENRYIYESAEIDGVEYIGIGRFYTLKKINGIWKITDLGTTGP